MLAGRTRNTVTYIVITTQHASGTLMAKIGMETRHVMPLIINENVKV